MNQKSGNHLSAEVTDAAIRGIVKNSLLTTEWHLQPRREIGFGSITPDRTRRVKLWLLVGPVAAVVGLAGWLAADGLGVAPRQAADSTKPHVERSSVRSVSDVSSTLNLDILSNVSQGVVNLASGNTSVAAVSVSSSLRAMDVALGMPRQSGILGMSANGAGYLAVSYDLQSVGAQVATYGFPPAAASSIDDVWLTRVETGTTVAFEIDLRTGATVSSHAIPSNFYVIGQTGNTLVLRGPAPDQVVELWNSAADSRLADLGPVDQSLCTNGFILWSRGNVLHIDNSSGAEVNRIVGPQGTWLTDMTVAFDNPDSVAILWQSAPGQSTDESSSVSLVRVSSGSEMVIPDTQDAVGPLAVSSLNGVVFYGLKSGHGAKVSGYSLRTGSSFALDIPSIDVPPYFSSTTGAIVLWNRPTGS